MSVLQFSIDQFEPEYREGVAALAKDLMVIGGHDERTAARAIRWVFWSTFDRTKIKTLQKQVNWLSGKSSYTHAESVSAILYVMQATNSACWVAARVAYGKYEDRDKPNAIDGTQDGNRFIELAEATNNASNPH